MNSFLPILMAALVMLLVGLALSPARMRGLFALGRVVSRWSKHPLFRPALIVVAMFVLVLLDRQALAVVPFMLGSTLTEGSRPGDFIISEANGTFSRDTVTVRVPAGTKYSPGLVVGKVTSGGKYIAADQDAGDGSQTIAGILYGICDNEDSDSDTDFSAVIVNRDAEVRGPGVDANGGAEATVLAELLALGIKVRGDLTNVAT